MTDNRYWADQELQPLVSDIQLRVYTEKIAWLQSGNIPECYGIKE